MPIHEFQCESCRYTFELLLMSQSEMENVRCPKCQSPDVNRLMSAANISTEGGTIVNKTSSGGAVEHRKCETGTCSTINLSGYQE